MKKLRRILVAVGNLRRAHGGVLRRAAELSRATGARVELFHAVTEPHTDTKRSANGVTNLLVTPEESVRYAQQCLERIAKSKLLQGCRVQPVAVWDKPVHEAIIRHALRTHCDLIISGTQPRGLASRILLRHTDWELVRGTPVPLLLVKSGRLVRKPVVLAAIDPLHANSKPARLDPLLLDAADSMAGLLKGTVHAFHAYMPLSVTLAEGLGEPLVWDSTEVDASHAQRVAREFTRALRGTAIPASRRHLRLGGVATELVACAARIRASLVVMGAVSRSRLDRLFIGTVAERVLDELTCDVLIVRPASLKRAAKSPKHRAIK